jgi:hypothetical protein
MNAAADSAVPIPLPIVPTVPKGDVAFESYAKINWANQHLQTLHQRFIEFAKTDFCSVTVERTPENGHPFLKVDAKPLPDEVSLIVGDVAHNLRSALDILWNTMRRRLGGAEGYFPICEKRQELEGTLKADKTVIPAVPLIWEILLERSKLYKTGTPPGTPHVWYLNRLDRPDKHSTLVATDIEGRVTIHMMDKGHNLYVTRGFPFRAGVTEVPVRLWNELDNMTFGNPLLVPVFDVPGLDKVPVMQGFGQIAAVVTQLVGDFSEAWRAIGRM